VGAPRKDLPALGARLRDARTTAGLSQKALGLLVREAQTNISNYELGIVEIPFTTLTRVVKACRVPRDQWAEFFDAIDELPPDETTADTPAEDAA
jgi:transcriptional regulator with XRE-family HTH domain